MFWTDLFANLWQHAELPNSKSDALKHGYLGPMPSTGYGGPVQCRHCLDHALLKRPDRNIILVKYVTLNYAECLQDQATASSSVYRHISFSPCNKNLENSYL